MFLPQLRMIYCFLRLTLHITSSIESSQALELDTNLTCSSRNPPDHHPPIFRPTRNFQKIKRGQDIPPGLHVRMNLYTGEKEARLNIPLMEENNAVDDLKSLPIETALIAVVKENSGMEFSRDQAFFESKLLDDKIPLPLSQSELLAFQNSLSVLKNVGPSIDQALENLSEFAHDIYYGREIAREDSILELLACLTLGIELENTPKNQINRERIAASILSSAFQNNLAALKELNNNKDKIMYPSCIPNTEGDLGKENFVDIFRNKLEQENDALTLKSKIITISRLLKCYSFRDLFLENGGMELLLAIFLKRGEEFNVVRKKIGELLMDSFLDESSGAQLNIWPRALRSSKSFCEKYQNIFQDGCWEYHIEEFSEQFPTEDWAKGLLHTLEKFRPKKYLPKYEL